MAAFLRFLAPRSHWKYLLPLFLIQVGIQIYFGAYLGPKIEDLTGGQPPLDIQGFYSTETARSFLQRLSPAAIDAYLYESVPVDTLYPLCYSFFYALLGLFLWRKNAWRYEKGGQLFLLFFVVGLADIAENSLQAHWMLKGVDAQTTLWPLVAASSLKWGLLFILLPALLFLAFRWAYRALST